MLICRVREVAIVIFIFAFMLRSYSRNFIVSVGSGAARLGAGLQECSGDGLRWGSASKEAGALRRRCE